MFLDKCTFLGSLVLCVPEQGAQETYRGRQGVPRKAIGGARSVQESCEGPRLIKHDQDWTGSDMIRASQICDGKWPAEGGFSVTNLGNLDKIRHDQGWLAEGDFP